MAPDISTILKSLFFTLILLNIKSFPLAYTIRSIPAIFKILQYRNCEKKRDLFQTIETRHTAFFDDLDSNIHLSNSSYNKLLDHARGNFFAEAFANAIWNHKPDIMLKSVLTVFNQEIPPLSRFSIYTRILTWDQKWVFLISYFKLRSNNQITSLGIARFVFKERNGKTINPEKIFEASGYFKDESEEEKEEREKRRQRGMKFVEGMYTSEKLFDENFVGDLNLDKKKDKNDKILAKL